MGAHAGMPKHSKLEMRIGTAGARPAANGSASKCASPTKPPGLLGAWRCDQIGADPTRGRLRSWSLWAVFEARGAHSRV